MNTHKTNLKADKVVTGICISVFNCSSLSMISKSSHNNVILNNSTKQRRVNEVSYRLHSVSSRNKVGRLTGFPKL